VHQAGRDGLRSALMVELTLDAACMLISVSQLPTILVSGLNLICEGAGSPFLVPPL
jgi:hypothetical protein